jgi:hypothetical protein
MTCSFCDAENPKVAVYCAECGEAFYQASSWRSAHVFYDADSHVSLRAHLSIANRGRGGIVPTKLTSADGTVEKEFSDTSAVFEGEEERMIAFKTHEAMEVDGVVDDLRCHFRRTKDFGTADEFAVPAPPLTFSPYPQVEIEVEDGFLVSEDSTVHEAPPGPREPSEDGVLPLQLRVSTSYSVEGTVRVRNDAHAYLTSVRLHTEDGRSVHRKRYDERTSDFAVPLPEETHRRLGEPETYTLTVEVAGVEAPIEIDFTPEYLHAPDLQLLVERPTKAGWAFVGRSARTFNDVSRRRVEAGDSPLHPERRKALGTDSLVKDTWDDIERDDPLVRWRVPKGQARTKRVAIDRVKEDDRENGDQEDERIEYDVRVALGGETRQMGPFTATARRVVSVPIPALDDSASGSIEIRLRNADHTVHFDVQADVFERRPLDVPVAIDFGTTNSCVALSLPTPQGGRYVTDARLESTVLVPLGRMHDSRSQFSRMPEAADPISTSQIIPTRVFRTADGELDIEPGSRPESRFEQFKIRMDQDQTFSTDQSEQERPEALSRVFLTAVLRRTALFLEERGLPPSELTPITCSFPTAFTRQERESIDAAYKAAQEPLVSTTTPRRNVMDESMSVFRFQRLTDLEASMKDYTDTGAVVLVYDFGGGTTDVTALYARADRTDDVVTWRYVELAAGGNSRLGGESVTDQLAQSIFGDNLMSEYFADRPTTAREEAEGVKRNLDQYDGLGSSAPDNLFDDGAPSEAARESLRKALGVDTKREAAKEIRRRVEEDVLDPLRTQCGEILHDVLDKSHRRLDDHASAASGPIPVLVLLAGNASRLSGFADLVDDAAREQVDRLDGPPELSVERVARVAEPKASVAKGGYLSEGRMGDVDDRYRPHVSYWMKLGLDVEETTLDVKRDAEGTRFVQIAPEGERPFSQEVTLRELGIFNTGSYQIYQRQGVVFQPLPDPVYLEVDDPSQRVRIHVDDEESVSVRIASPA